MSKFADFKKKVTEDAPLAADYKKILENNKISADTKLADYSDAVINELIALAKKAGFDFTVDEVKALNTAELSDDELEAVAGGATQVCLMTGK